MKKIMILALAVMLILTGGCLAAQGKDNGGTKKVANRIAVFETNMGTFEIELFEDKAPKTTKNFIDLVEKNFYDGVIFHRVIDGFMIQGGGFTKDLNQKPTRGPVRNEAANGLRNLRGSIAMARTSVVDSATSQFFINLVDNDFLDFSAPTPAGFGYAVFGRVADGMEVVDAIAKVKTGARGRYENVPDESVVIRRVTIS